MVLLDCIKRIGSCLEKILLRYPTLKEEVSNYLKDGVDELVFVASGSSMNASRVTRYYAEKVCGLKTRFFFPNEFKNYLNHDNPNALYIFVSQGGSTRLVYESLEMVNQKGFKTLSITESLDAPIAQIAGLKVEMGSEHEEFVYRTIGYSTTSATLYLIETICALVNKHDIDEEKVLNDLRSVISNLPLLIEKTEAWYKRNKFSLMRRSKAILAGAEVLWEVSNEADIKLMEMVPLMTRSFELEELIHGPQNAFDDATLFFILVDQKNDAEKAQKIATFLKKEIGYCALVGDVTMDDKDLYYSYQSEYFRSLEAITPFQVLAYYMADDHGRDLSRGVNANMTNYITKLL